MVNKNFINFLAEGQPEYTDGGVLAEFTWLIVVLPFLAAILIYFFWKISSFTRSRTSSRNSFIHIFIQRGFTL